MEILKKIFGSSKTFLLSFICIILIWTLYKIIYGNFVYSSNTLYIMWIVLIALFATFIFKESNIQKGLISAIYVLNIVLVFEKIQLYKLNNELICLILWFVLFVIYLLMQSNKVGSTILLFINYIFLFILCVSIICISILNKEMHLILFRLPIIIFIMCIQTKIHLYKEFRNKCKNDGTWTEEKKIEAKNIFNIL